MRRQTPKPGQIWRRLSDGQETTVIAIPDRHSLRPYVSHRGKRMAYTELPNFLRKYKLVQEVDE